jgi:PAS domain S-box-containing protein
LLQNVGQRREGERDDPMEVLRVTGERATRIASVGAPRSVAASGGLSFVLVLVTALIGLQLQEQRIAVFWPTAGVILGLVLTSPKGAKRLAVLAGAVAALALGNVLQGRGLEAALVFLGGNALQAVLITMVLTRGGREPRLQTLTGVVEFLLVCWASAAAVGLMVAGGLVAVGYATAPLGQVWQIWLISHGIGLVTVAPAIVALTRDWRRARSGFAGPRFEWLQMALLAAITHVLLDNTPAGSTLSATFVVVVLYAPLLWIAVRLESLWSSVALLIVSVVVMSDTGAGVGPFTSDAHIAVMLLLAASMWTLTLGAILDQQRLALRQAVDSEERMRAALGIGNAFAFDWDPRTDLVVRSDARQIIGHVQAEPASAFFDRVHPDDRARLAAQLAALRPDRPTYGTRYRYRHNDGRVVWLEESARAEFDSEGRLLRLRGMTADVTEQKRAEEALHEADRAKDRFIATLSHELRNPLAPIRNAVALLRRRRALEPDVRICHDMIDRQVAHMGYLLDELLDVGRISQGKFRLNPLRVSLRSVLAEAVETVRPAFEAGGQTLALDQPEGQVWLTADPVRLTQTIVNLLGNAAKYSERGSEVALQAVVNPARGDSESPHELVLSVRDHGVGMAHADLERVFDMFTQLGSAQEKPQGGLGIGLWLVRQIVTLHGGTVEARSDGIGCGSEFIVRMPVVTEHEAAAQPLSQPGEPIL